MNDSDSSLFSASSRTVTLRCSRSRWRIRPTLGTEASAGGRPSFLFMAASYSPADEILLPTKYRSAAQNIRGVRSAGKEGSGGFSGDQGF
jgi:hypothetical protein